MYLFMADQSTCTFDFDPCIMLREDWTAGCEAVQRGLQFKVYTSDTLYTSPMPVRSKIKGVMSFVRAIGNDEKDDHPQRPLIRHQNPRLNAPGVEPAPPLLTPPRTKVKPLANEARPRILPGEAAALIETRNSGYRPTEQSLQESTKKSSKQGKVLVERHVVATRARDAAKPPPRTPSPKTKATAQQAPPATHPP
ncbi:MAG: hypothetical protein Q9207_008492, partial [Kuettlingeria erythrocarpa]